MLTHLSVDLKVTAFGREMQGEQKSQVKMLIQVGWCILPVGALGDLL